MPLTDAVANTTLLEALACGLPTAVTDVGAVRDYVDDYSAYLVPPADPDAMLEAIIRLLHAQKNAHGCLRMPGSEH